MNTVSFQSLSDFHFDLPQECIAAHPSSERDAAKLMHVSQFGNFGHYQFSDLPRLLRAGDCLVLNDTHVIPARLILRRAQTYGTVELLLVKQQSEQIWEAIVRPARKLPPGSYLELPQSAGYAEVLEGGSERTRLIKFNLNIPQGMQALLEQWGAPPLPPYILKRRKMIGEAPVATPQDRVRYQTVYAQSNSQGSIAAPTAGLHFTPRLLKEIEAMGVTVCRVTLDVGIGTFEPIVVQNLDEHIMHEEKYSITPENALIIEQARIDPQRRIIAVGTTATRTLESCFEVHEKIMAGQGSTRLFIRPGRPFGVVQAMITNFHLPESTLLMLVAAMVGPQRILDAYHEAIRQGYLFYSYGDAMFIQP